jgi:hypothetical protein
VFVGLQFSERTRISYYLTTRIYLKERGHNIFVPGRFKNADKDKENIHYRRRDSHRRAHESCSINCSSPERGRGGEHQQTRCHAHQFRLRHRCFFGVFCYRNRAARVYGTTSDTVSVRSTKTVVAADDGQVGAAPSQHAADRGGEPAALRDRVELRIAAPCGDMRAGKSCRVPAARNDMAATRDSLSARSCPPGYTRDGPLEPCPAVISARSIMRSGRASNHRASRSTM